MFRHELSHFLQAVLDAVAYAGGLTLDRYGDPEASFVLPLARRLNAEPEQIQQALAGLRACHCLIEDALEIPGTEPIVRWQVHPQCLPSPSASTGC